MGKMRHYQRFSVSGSGYIHHKPTHIAAFSINNISASGMNITSNVDFAKDEVVVLEVQVSGSALPYFKHLTGRVVRKHKCDSIYHYGILFIELPVKDMIEIDEYLRLNYTSAPAHQTSYDTGNEEHPIQQLYLRNKDC